MIVLKMLAQTGNNMFQYAACRTLAQDRGFRFSFRGGRKGRLRRYFLLGGETSVSLGLNALIHALDPRSRGREYRPPRVSLTDSVDDELFDQSFFHIQDGTTIRGFFQSERYFKHNRKNVLRWMTPRKRYRDMIERIAAGLPAPVEKRCCIHLRRCDYLVMDKKYAGLGWVLPFGYYKQALERLPDDLYYIIVSDDPDEAERLFSFLPDKYIARDNPGVVDMFLFTRSKYNVIANSSFSWWGAWLNQTPGKLVLAPAYHLGWPLGKWCPSGMKVNEWEYIDVPAVVQRLSDSA